MCTGNFKKTKTVVAEGRPRPEQTQREAPPFTEERDATVRRRHLTDDVPLSIKKHSEAARRQHLLNDVPLGFVKPLPNVLLVGKARGKELVWNHLPPAQKQQFLVAMCKEWAKWEQFRATIPCPKKVLAKYPDNLKIIGTRWVFTHKGDGTAKARLVVQGCQENLKDVRGDAPTGSRDSMMMVIAFGSQTSWSLSQWDADSAY